MGSGLKQRTLTLGSVQAGERGEGRTEAPVPPWAVTQKLRSHPSSPSCSPTGRPPSLPPPPPARGLWPSQAVGELRLGLVVLRALLSVSVCLSVSPSLC